MHRLQPGTSNVAFAILFGALLGLFVLVGWSNPAPPLQDLGAHIEMMDIAAHHDEPGTSYEHYYTLPDRPLPNTLSLGVAWLLSDLLDTTAVAKLLLTFYLVGFPLALLWLCRVMHRPRWWVFLAAPLTLNPLLPLGLLNYLLALPLIVVSLAASVRWVRDGHRPSAVLLGIALVLLAFAHMIGYLFGALLVGFVILLYLRRPPDVLRFLVLLPSLVPGLGFASLLLSFPTRSGGGSQLVWAGADTGLSRVWADAIDAFTGPLDDVVGVVLALVTLALLFQQQALTTPELAPGSKRPLDVARRRPLATLVVLIALAYMVAPHRYGDVWIQFRLPALLVPLLLLLPRWRPTVLSRVCVGLGIAASFTAAASAVVDYRHAGSKYDRLIERLAHLPTASRLASPLPGADPDSQFHYHVQRGARGLHGWLNGGASSHGFMTNYYTPVRFKDGFAPPNPANLLSRQIHDFDYGLVRAFEPPDTLLTAPHLVPLWDADDWWLFKVIDPNPPRYIVATHGRLGSPGNLACPKDSAAVGFRFAYDGLGLRSVLMRCSKLSHLKVVVGKPRPTATLGKNTADAEAVNVDCPTGQVVVGLVGNEGNTIRSVGVLCQLARDAHTNPATSTTARTRVTVKMPPASKLPPHPELPAFVLQCPEGTGAVGFRGRTGTRVEAVGLACDGLVPTQTD